jgi:ferric-dicitrate binding protein FerR (iron transport regulator)
VQLNRNSKISFPEEFEGDERNVTLEGEAYFEIKKQSTKRFNVYAGNTKTTVLGTKFGVNAYEDVEEVEVTVYEGKVAFEDVSTQEEEKTQVILEKNDKVVLNKKSRAIKKRKHNGKPLQWLLKNIGKEIKKIGKGIKNAGKELKNSLKKKKED